MSITVITTSTAQLPLARRLLPATGRAVYGERCSYFFYETDGGEDCAYTDVDGSPLITARTFRTAVEADAWVRADMRRAA